MQWLNATFPSKQGFTFLRIYLIIKLRAKTMVRMQPITMQLRCHPMHRHRFRGQMSDTFRAAIFVTLSGGFQDAYTYICRGEVFANAQTGNIVLLSAALLQRDWATCLKYCIPLASFVFGTLLAEFIHFRFRNYQYLHWRQLVLAAEIFLLFCVCFLPHRLDPLANALVSLVCAMQVHSFHKIHGHAYASTMCIGNLRSAAESLGEFIHSRDPKALESARTYFGIILIFGAGAALGSYVTQLVGERAILGSCILLLVSFVLMFVRGEPEKKA